jgi:hypothetical protein
VESDDQPKPGCRDFYLVGAGFSRAVSPFMPVMWELRDAVLEEMELQKDHLDGFGGDLEQWLSYLSTEQPWLEESENLRNRAQFIEASRAITTVIRRAEDSIQFSEPPPFWLVRLAHQWGASQAPIATLNYDLLVERAITSLGGVYTLGDMYAIPLEQRRAAGDAGGGQYSALPPRVAVPTLFKLHGSTNWMYGGSAASPGERVVLSGDGFGWERPSSAASWVPRYQVLHDDLVPMVIPPTSVKNTFYQNLSLRAQWRSAARRLRRAERLIVIGYSFPKSDLQMRQFIATSIREIPVIVVDRSPDPAAEVRRLLPSCGVSTFTGDDAVKTFVECTCPNVVGASVAPDPDTGNLVAELRWNDQLIWTADGLTGDVDQAAALVRSEAYRRWPEATGGLHEDFTRTRSSVAALQEFTLIH